jgi:hypothetical protein
MIGNEEHQAELHIKMKELGKDKIALGELAKELKAANIPVSEALFSKLKNALKWSETEEKTWSHIKQAPGFAGMLSVAVRWTTDPKLELNKAVEHRLAQLEKQEEGMHEQMVLLRQEQSVLHAEFKGNITKASEKFEDAIRQCIGEIPAISERVEERQILEEARKGLEKLGEQLFGENDKHKAMFAEFDQLAKPKSVTQEFPEDVRPERRQELYEKFFGENGLEKKYLEQRKSKSLVKIVDKFKDKVGVTSEEKIRIQYFSEVKVILKQYQETGNPEILSDLLVKIQLDLDEKDFFKSLSAPPKKNWTEKRSSSNDNIDSMRGFLDRFVTSLKDEFATRMKVSREQLGQKPPAK